MKMDLPKKCIVDTNVPIMANRALRRDCVPEEEAKDVSACVAAIRHVMRNQCLVIDDGDEIFNEYRTHLSLKGCPGVGDSFMKWVNDYRWQLPRDQRVKITKTQARNNDNLYDEFPDITMHPGLDDFDNSDRKFIAVANAYTDTDEDKPSILQGTDSKWWGWKKALCGAGITVIFLCPEYIKRKYKEKIGA